MATCLKLAAVYNILWGAWVVIWPNSFFEWTGMAPLQHPTIWQGTGMIVGGLWVGLLVGKLQSAQTLAHRRRWLSGKNFRASRLPFQLPRFRGKSLFSLATPSTPTI